MNLQLDDVALFLRVVELGSLSAAARESDVSVSQVTRALARLESTCGLRLLNRTTHSLSLTDEGDTFVAHSRMLLDTAASLNADLTGKLGGPSGWVRISTSPLLAQTVIVPSLPTLYAQYPQLHIDLNADDRMIDMAREGIDIAIRTGTTHSDTVVAREIGDYTRRLYAAPAYLAQFGTPQHPDDLQQHRLLTNSASPALNRWQLLTKPGAQPAELSVQGHTRTDNSAVMMSLVQHGVGIARLMDLLAEPLVRRGELVPLLREHMQAQRVPIYAVMPRQRQRLPKIRACIDHWAAWLAQLQPAT